LTVSERPQSLWQLRAAALVAVLAGAIGAIGLWIHAARHPPPLIVALFVLWVLSPFAILGIGCVVAKRWSPGLQKALYWVALFVALATLVIYRDDAIAHRTTHPAFVYVAVPPASWLVTIAAVTITALRARKRRPEP
jgi:hypothetical protein